MREVFKVKVTQRYHIGLGEGKQRSASIHLILLSPVQSIICMF